jgi:PAS domain S-box-containing protein
MNLRTKLLAGYLVFIVALVLLGGWSAWRLREMGDVSRRIIENNYDSVVAAQDMKESLERQDSAAVFALLGARERAVKQMQEYRAQFDAALDKEAHNITEPGEQELVETIKRERDEYYKLFDDFLVDTDTPATPELLNIPDKDESSGQASGQIITRGRVVYFNVLEPLFNQLRGHCDDVLRLNQQAMQGKSQAASGVARRWFLLTLLIAGSLVAAGLTLAFFLSNRIVQPLRELSKTTARIAGGDLGAKVNIISHDEIGLLGAEYNRMGERIRQLRRSDMGKLVVAQQTTEAAIDSLYDPVLVTNAAGCVTKLNHAAEEIFGTEAENTGKHIGEVARDSRIASAVAEALSSQRAVADEDSASILPLHVDGSQRAFRLRTTPMRDNENHLLGAVTLLEDITHLREIDRLKSEFIATASHELRTPLTSIQMGVHLLLENAVGELTLKQQEVLAACRQDCERLEKLMRDLLDLSKIEAGESRPQLVPIRTRDLMDVAEALRPQVETKGIQLKIDASPDLPSVLADRAQIERVINNLVTNAVRHTKRGGEIRVGSIRMGDHIAFSVCDTGSGIPPVYLPHVFDKFVQVPDAPNGGAGLGLAISKSIIEAHDGQISVQSKEGRGTTFTFTLPVA